MVTKKVKKIPKNVKTLCKKYSIRLTIKRGPKRIKKTLCVLLKEIKKKMKGTKGTHFGKRRRRRFGEGEENGEQPLPEGEQPLQVQGKKANLFKRAGKGFVNKSKAAGRAAKRNPGKSIVAGLAVVGAATMMAASGGLLGPEAMVMAGTAVKSAGSMGAKFSGKVGKMGQTIVEKGAEASTQISFENVNKLNDTVAKSKQTLAPVLEAVHKENNEEIKEAVKEAAQVGATQGAAAGAASFGKRRKRTRFGDCGCGKVYPQFGKSKFGKSKFGNTNELGKQQVMNFGMTQKKAMEIIRKLYRKNCKL
jgi:hypothetical protein